MKLICSCCGRDLNAICQANMSYRPGYVECEDCSGYTLEKMRYESMYPSEQEGSATDE